MRGRCGFTVFDLLLILAILAILLGLLLPAVQQVREAARRAESTNNLKSIAIACHTYNDTARKFPTLKTKKEMPITVAILPYIEQDNLYLQYQNNGIKALKGVRVPTYMSPRDPMTQNKGTFNSYLFNAGTKYSLTKNNGVFYYDSKITPGGLANGDGSSNTILAAETLVGSPAMKTNSVRRQHVLFDKKALKKLTAKSGVTEFKNKKNIASDRGHRWSDPSFLQVAFTMTRKINDTRPDVNCGGEGGLSGLRSNGRVALVALCDGSVRSLDQGISFRTLQAVSTANGGDVHGKDW